MLKLLTPSAHARHARCLATRASASAAIEVSWSRRKPCGSMVCARPRPCHPIVKQLQSAQQLHVEVVVGLAAARSVGKLVPPSRAVPSRARRARSRRCEVHMSVHRCTNVQWSCLCSAVEMCAGVCTVGVYTRVLARACACVLRKGCRTSLRARETALPFPSCATTGPAPRARGHPPWRAVHRSFSLYLYIYLYT